MNRSLIYYMELQEGKKLDKLKKHLKKHKGKYLLGVAGTALAARLGRIAYDVKNTHVTSADLGVDPNKKTVFDLLDPNKKSDKKTVLDH